MVSKKGKGKTRSESKVNPFELKFNRSKFSVLGKKFSSKAAGKPTLSKKVAFQKRVETLGSEHDSLGKVNKIVDRRIGEKDSTKTDAEKSSLRFTAERVKSLKKSSKFNLGDVEEEDTSDILTHSGKSLTDVQKYDKTIASDDDDDEPGNIGAALVKHVHFGGGEDTTGKPSRKDLITELIAKSKFTKQEKQLAKDEQETVTTNLDDKYHKLLGKIQSGFRPIGATKNEKEENDDYDKLATMLKLDADARATPSERTKTTEELALEAKEQLDEFEALRIARMNAEKNKSTHRSADDDISFATQSAKEIAKGKRFQLRFDEHGHMMDADKVEKAVYKLQATSDDEFSEDMEDEDDEDLDDLIETEERESLNTTKEDAKVDLSLPFVFDMPSTYGKLVKLLEVYAPSDLGTIFERLIKCHHPSLKEGNKKRLSKVFLYALRYYDDVAKSAFTQDKIDTLGCLQKPLYSLLKFDVEFGVRCVRALIRQHWKLRDERQTKDPVNFSQIALVRLVIAMFPVSDVWHPVCSPLLVLMARTVSDCQITSLTVLARQILFATCIGDVIEESKRYVPEVLAFLHGSVLMAVESSDDERAPSSSFPISLPHRRMLYVDEAVDKNSDLSAISFKEVFNDCSPLADNAINRCRVLRALIAILQKFRIVYNVHEFSFTASFTPIVKLLKRIPVDNLPSSLCEEILALCQSTEAECRVRSKLTQLSRVKTEKSMLKMLEPLFEYNFDPERPRFGRDSSRKGEAGEKKKLQYLVKKETRGAIKELRKDNAFLNRKQREATKSKDKDRNRKTKALMASLQDQQGEWNKEKAETERDKKRDRKR